MPSQSMQENLQYEELLSGMPLPFSEDVAVALGLKRSAYPEAQEVIDEVTRIDRMRLIMTRIQQEHDLQQDVIFSRFSAMYLPATVDRFLNPPSLPPGLRSPVSSPPIEELFQLINPYFDVLVQIQHLPYFSKFLRSQHPSATNGRRLPEALASRLAELAPKLNSGRMLQSHEAFKREYYERTLGDVCQLLSTLLVVYTRDKDRAGLITPTIKAKLTPYLRRWSQQYHNSFAGDTTSRTIELLNDHSRLREEFEPVRKYFKGLSECGLPGCSATANLKACARCVTIKYCSPEHQRADWSSPLKSHKQLCHKTEY
ncbi:hypothetical protein BKA70DRAFT_1403511, partial [Coprinopsis sp. MPI-PUGE-AT-0042]